MKRILVCGLAALGLVLTSQAHATTYLLDMSEMFSDVGKLSATDNYSAANAIEAASGKLNFWASLSAGFKFVDTKLYQAFLLDRDPTTPLPGLPLATTGVGDLSFSLQEPASAGAARNTPFQNVDYASACSALCDANRGIYAGLPGSDSMTFYVDATKPRTTLIGTMSDFATKAYDSAQNAFEADLQSRENDLTDGDAS